jgi:protein ImuB
MRLAAISPEALALGLTPSMTSIMTLADARVRVPDLEAVDMDRAADRAWQERIADFCDRYTPLVALADHDTLLLDITGCAHLFGGEAAMRDDVLARLSHVATQLRASVASTPQAAQAHARFGMSTNNMSKDARGCIIPPGQDATFTAPLPVAALGITVETVTALRRAGLKSVRDLALRPRGALAARFGPDILNRLSRVLGEEDISITPRRALPPCSVERRFAEPIGQTDDVLGILNHLIGEASGTLEKRGQGGRVFVASFFRVDGHVAKLQVETARPARDAASVMRLFRERISALSHPLDAGFGYDLVRLSVPAIAPFKQIQRSLDGKAVENDQVIALIDRLGARLGQPNVQRLMICNSHIPEQAACAIAAATIPARSAMIPASPAARSIAPEASHGASQAELEPQPGSIPIRPLHLFTRPHPIEALAEVPDGPPLRFRWRKMLHDVIRAEGPERIAPQWWQSLEPAPEPGPEPGLEQSGAPSATRDRTRDYFRVEDEKGRRFWLFREGLYGQETARPRWFVHGLFPGQTSRCREQA